MHILDKPTRCGCGRMMTRTFGPDNVCVTCNANAVRPRAASFSGHTWGPRWGAMMHSLKSMVYRATRRALRSQV